MKIKDLERKLASELADMTPDFDKILDKINSTIVHTPVNNTCPSATQKVDGRYKNIWNKRVTVSKRQPKLKIATALISMCMCCLLVVVSMFAVGVFSFDGEQTIDLDKRANSYVTININPEIELAVNKFNKITTATATNNSGKLLLAQLYKELDVTTLVGQELNGALISLIDQSAKMGYIDVKATTFTNAVMIDVVGNATAATDKALLAGEAKQYFADKGIYAVVVTNYDSKKSLVEEAKKHNPNASINTPIADLISTVESGNGGKDLYQQEIDRITADNAKYQEYIDSMLIADVKITLDKRVVDLNGFIAKENKIIEGYKAILTGYQSELEALGLDLESSNKNLQILNKQYADAEASIENSGVVTGLRRQLADAQAGIDKLNDEISMLDCQLVTLKQDYDAKVIYLNNLTSEKEGEIARLTKDNEDTKAVVQQAQIDKSSQGIALQSKKDDLALTQSILTVENGRLTDVNAAITSLESDRKLYSINVTYGNMFNVYATANSAVKGIMPKYNVPLPNSDNCAICNPQLAAFYTMDYLTKNNRLLYLLANTAGDTFEARLNSVVTTAVTKVTTDVGLGYYTQSVIDTYNKGADKNKIIDTVKTAMWDEAKLRDYTFNYLAVNLSAACKVYGITYGEQSMVINIEDIKTKCDIYSQNVADIDSKIAIKKSERGVLVEAIYTITTEIDAINTDIAATESAIESLDNLIKDSNTLILSNNYAIAKATSDIEEYSQEIISVGKAYAKGKLDVENRKVVASDKIKVLDGEVATINLAINEYFAQNSQVLEAIDAKILAEAANTIAINQSIEDKKIQMLPLTVEITVSSDRIIGYNVTVGEIKKFSNSYSAGNRISLDDKVMDLSINTDIAAIEQAVIDKKNDSLAQMKDNIKSNLDKQAEYRYNKNIGKYNDHSSSITAEEYAAWEATQHEQVEALGWASMYEQWLAKQD